MWSFLAWLAFNDTVDFWLLVPLQKNKEPNWPIKYSLTFCTWLVGLDFVFPWWDKQPEINCVSKHTVLCSSQVQWMQLAMCCVSIRPTQWLSLVSKWTSVTWLCSWKCACFVWIQMVHIMYVCKGKGHRFSISIPYIVSWLIALCAIEQEIETSVPQCSKSCAKYLRVTAAAVLLVYIGQLIEVYTCHSVAA